MRFIPSATPWWRRSSWGLLRVGHLRKKTRVSVRMQTVLQFRRSKTHGTNLSCACECVRVQVQVFVRLKYNFWLSHFETGLGLWADLIVNGEIHGFQKLKSKGIPRQAEVALGVPGRLMSRIFSTFCTTRMEGRQPNALEVFTPGEIPGTHFQRLSRPQGTWFCRKEPRKKSQVTPPGIDPGTVRLLAQCLNHYATPGPHTLISTHVKFCLLTKFK